jgi:hypothetical protein
MATAPRPFAPTAFGIARPSFYAGLVEARLKHSGEYVRHIPAGQPAQWVVANYQFIPREASITPDFAMGSANPQLWAYADHFETRPTSFKDGNSLTAPKGSMFEIRGILYRVRKADINHRGYLHCELAREANCVVARPDFDDDVAGFLCAEAPCA